MGETKIDLSADEVMMIGGVLEMRGIKILLEIRLVINIKFR